MPGADGERRVALRQRHRDEGLLGRRLLGDAGHLGRAHTHGLFHHEGDALIEQVVRGLRHAIVLAERDHEVGLRLRQHLPIVGEDRRLADLGGAPGRDGGVGVVEADELDVRHRGEDAQVGGVPERVPVTDSMAATRISSPDQRDRSRDL